MTPQEKLRRLAQQATPGPWEFSDSTDPRGHKGEFRAPNPYNGFMLVGPWTNDSDASLMALSPELAVWAADAADALAGVEPELVPNHDAAEKLREKLLGGPPSPNAALIHGIRALLARLAEITGGEK